MEAPPWALAQMQWIEGLRTPVGDALFCGLTMLGTEPFLLFFVAVGYWAADRSVFLKATAMLIVAAYVNALLKGIFLEPRPSVVSHVLPAEGWSFPSGHAQIAAALWGMLAVQVWQGQGPKGRQRGLALALLGLAVGIAASRPYLGVHYPHDVAAGLGLGAFQVALWWALQERYQRPKEGGWAVLAALGLCLAGAGVFHESTAGAGLRLAAAGLGLSLGILLKPPSAVSRLLLLLLGLAGTLSIWMGLKKLFALWGLGELFAVVRYLLLGLWIAWGAPKVTQLAWDRLRLFAKRAKVEA